MGKTYVIDKEAFISELSKFANNSKWFDVIKVKASNEGDTRDVEVLVVRWKSFYFDIEYLVLPVCYFVEKMKKADELLYANKPRWNTHCNIMAKVLGRIDMDYKLSTGWIDTISPFGNVLRSINFDKTDMFSFVFKESPNKDLKLIHTPIWCDKGWSMDNWSLELPDEEKFVRRVQDVTPDNENEILLLDPIYPHIKYRKIEPNESEGEDSDLEVEEPDFEDDDNLFDWDDELMDEICGTKDKDVAGSSANESSATGDEDEPIECVDRKRTIGVGLLAAGVSIVTLCVLRLLRKKIRKK